MGPYRKEFSRADDTWKIYDGDGEIIGEVQTEKMADILLEALTAGSEPCTTGGCFHEADPSSISSPPEAGTDVSLEWIVDVNCKHCGRSGSVRIDVEEIQWD